MSSIQNEYLPHRNSMDSTLIPIDIKSPKIKKLEKSYNKARDKAEKAKQITDSINNHQLEICKLVEEIEKRTKFLQKANEAALKIQKLFRGFLVRNHNDDVSFMQEILKIRRTMVSGWMSDLKRSDERNLTFTGKKPQWAGFILTRFAKRLLFFFKIKRITKAYLYFKALREEEGCKTVRISIGMIYCKYLVSLEKFYKYRKNRLVEIHQKLALLTIKNFYRNNNLSFSLIMKRIKKFKRMLKMCKSGSVHSKADFYSTKDHSTTRSEIFGGDSNADMKNIDDLGNIIECASLTSTEYLELEQARKEKIQFGMISYNIAKNKEPLPVLPYLYQKDIIEEHSPSRNYEVMTNCLISRMSAISPKRQNPRKMPMRKFKVELPSIIPLQTPKKIRFDNENLPNFTRPTASSMASRNPEEQTESSPKTVNYYRENTTLFNQTFSYVQKLSDIKPSPLSSYKKTTPPYFSRNLPSEPFPGSGGRVRREVKHYRAQTTFEMNKRLN